MPRHSICLISSHDGELLALGHELDCRGHKHIDPAKARLLANGTKYFPHLAEDAAPGAKITEPFYPSATWATLADGSLSTRHLVLFSARSWQVVNGGWQYRQIGDTTPPRKRTRTYLRHRGGSNGWPDRPMGCANLAR